MSIYAFLIIPSLFKSSIIVSGLAMTTITYSADSAKHMALDKELPLDKEQIGPLHTSTSSHEIQSPQCCVLGLLLYSLYTYVFINIQSLH